MNAQRAGISSHRLAVTQALLLRYWLLVEILPVHSHGTIAPRDGDQPLIEYFSIMVAHTSLAYPTTHPFVHLPTTHLQIQSPSQFGEPRNELAVS